MTYAMYTPKNKAQLMDILGDLQVYAEVNALNDVAEHLSDALIAARAHADRHGRENADVSGLAGEKEG